MSAMASEKDGERLAFTLQEVSKRLGVSARTIVRRVDAEQFPAPLYLGKLMLFRREDVERWLQESRGRRPGK